VIAVPQVSPGTGPHALKASCASCGQFIKWLPRALVQPQQKEYRMSASVNRVVLLGIIGKYGVEVRYATSGTPCASFALAVSEQGQDGKDYTTLIDCQVWGKKAEAAGELEPGQLVLFEGKLARRKKGDDWTLGVSGFEVTPITAAQPTLTGSSNEAKEIHGYLA
jgi:single stranded DNA-binding protein